ncbi:enoyl-CoA hydratase-related protein [Trujillonella endophytica]|uniref:Short chain enoyl-CoA hydratase n=1 Tax=Trujillonella endophytica TaxID=673521 RepID=A0A1H8Q4G5_9ACTN|nr:enoyl-CoA hydratase-related protein [Trujillella endophytica]SEO48794.1 short chain enoyl-CoA hydratase [Trujillella endophytica]
MPDRSAPASEPVRFEVLGEHVALVTLDRPEKRNAVNGAVARLLEDAVRRADADPDVRAVLLVSSHPRVFCAGADLSQIGAGNTEGPMETVEGGFAGFVRAPRRTPWIAVVEGAALAGGFEIALACDLLVASTAATFALPEVTRGLLATAGGVHRLPRVLPRNVALEMIATGAPLDAARAHAFGLVNRLTEPGAALAAAAELARGIAGNAPVAVQEALSAAKAAAGLPDAEGQALVEAAMARLRGTEDYAEGPRAFLEKRAPRWTGR